MKRGNVTIKPRIRREQSLKYKEPMWFCRGGGRMGIGSTPKDAYWVWRFFMAEL